MLPLDTNTRRWFQNEGLYWDLIILIGKNMNQQGILRELELGSMELNLIHYGDIDEAVKLYQEKSEGKKERGGGEGEKTKEITLVGKVGRYYTGQVEIFTCAGSILQHVIGEGERKEVLFITHVSDWNTNVISYATVLGKINHRDHTIEIHREVINGKMDTGTALMSMRLNRIIDASYALVPKKATVKQRKWTKGEHEMIMRAFEDKFDPPPGLIEDDDDGWWV
jgi:hypothetical protein